MSAGLVGDGLAAPNRLDEAGQMGGEFHHPGEHDRDDRVDRNRVAGELRGPRPVHRRDAGLGRGVGRLAEVAPLAGGRADEGQRPAFALLAEARHRGTSAGEGSRKYVATATSKSSSVSVSSVRFWRTPARSCS